MSFPEIYWLASRDGRPGRVERSSEGVGAGARSPFGRRVLITEDNWLIASEWEAALQEAGYEVVGIAVSADEAIDMCLREEPDFVLMDIRLLGVRDGIEAAIELRARTGTPSVFVSAHEDVETRRRAEAAQPLGWITKPVVGSRIPELLVRMARRRG